MSPFTHEEMGLEEEVLVQDPTENYDRAESNLSSELLALGWCFLYTLSTVMELTLGR